MDHCTGMQAGDVLDGRCYLYKVLHPVRATAEIVRHHMTKDLSGVHGFRNAKIPPPIVAEIQDAILLRNVSKRQALSPR